MRGYRADIAFDGERFLSGGALVLVEDEVIVGVEPASVPPPDGCEVRHLPGTTLLPGLVDTHTHLCGDGSPVGLDRLPDLDPGELDSLVATAKLQHLAAGVTTVRDLGDQQWAVVDRHRGAVDGPRVLGAGPPITSSRGHCWRMGGEASGPEALRRALRARAERGVDVVKVMASGGVLTAGTDVQAAQFSLAELRVVVDEAHHAGLAVTAHAHGLPAVEQCAAAGVDGIEHCSCLVPGGMRTRPELARALAEAGTVVCPTLGRSAGEATAPQLQAVLDMLGVTWERLLERVAELHAAGVVLVSGTDSGIGPSKPHGLVAEAVADLVAAGIPSAAALASATGVAARACGLQRRTGRLAAGLDADLLVVAGDLRTGIAGLGRPEVVVCRGREVRRSGRPVDGGPDRAAPASRG